MKKKVSWGLLSAIGGVLFFYTTIAVVGLYIVNGIVRAQTSQVVTLFDTWYQTLLFVLAVLGFILFVGGLVMFFIQKKKNKSEKPQEKPSNTSEKRWQKIFNRSFWSVSSVFWAIQMVAFVAGTSYAIGYAGWINSTLGVDAYATVDDSSNSTPNAMYYGSDYIKWRWHYNTETGKYEFQTAKDSVSARQHAVDVCEQVDNEGSVLLWNNNNALPLASGAKVSVFGVAQDGKDFLASGDGSGYHDMNTDDTLSGCLSNLGVTVNPGLASTYSRYATRYRHGSMSPNPDGDINYVEYTVNDAPWSKIETTADSTVAQYGDSAIFMISRNGGECGDTNFSTTECLDNNYEDLTNTEAEILKALSEYKQEGLIKHIVLVLNTTNAMQFKHIMDYDIDACLWVGTGGTAAFRSIADVLTGAADPSGRLADTYVYDSYSAPATVNFGDFTFSSYHGLPSTATYTHNTKYVVYQEGIYVGYRYYETRYEDLVLNQGEASGTFGAKNSNGNWTYNQEVAFPFGYGTSYATFEQNNFKAVKKGDSYVCSVDVKNTSTTYSGKDVFEVYLQKPYTDYDKEEGIEKSSVGLVGFAKTDALKPGETETVNVVVDPKEFASYDAYGHKTYILEKGNYYLACGTDSHEAINNILANKGVSAGELDGTSDASKAVEFTVDADDFTTYSVSATTGNAITNQFDDADLNLYSHTADQKIKYLSRNDWADTYPTKAVSLSCDDEGMIADMQYGHDVTDDSTVEAPKYNQNNGLSLIQLINEDYDSSKWDSLLDQLSWSETCKMTTWGSNALAGATSVSCPGSYTGDGPAGMRAAAGSVCYPSDTILACTYNQDLVDTLGNAFGMEMMDIGYNGIYGPGADIHRTNFSGRNWEYFSEDGFLTGKMLASEIKGLRNRGILPFEKHFALNDQERNRYGVTVWANEQTIREIYLKGFEASIEDSDNVAIMSSFNRIGCTWAGAHKGLLTNVLRKEWGFKGVVETDAAVGNHMTSYLAMIDGILAGEDVWMMGTDSISYSTYANNHLFQQAIRQAAKDNLYAQLHSYEMNGLKSGTKIVALTPWWETTLYACQDVTITLFSICAVMTLLSFGLAISRSIKQKKLQSFQSEESSKTGQK